MPFFPWDTLLSIQFYLKYISLVYTHSTICLYHSLLLFVFIVYYNCGLEWQVQYKLASDAVVLDDNIIIENERPLVSRYDENWFHILQQSILQYNLT